MVLVSIATSQVIPKYSYICSAREGQGHHTYKCCAQTLVTPWTVVRQAPLSTGFSRQEYWDGLPCPSPGDLPHPGTEPKSSALEADSLLSEPPGKPLSHHNMNQIALKAIFTIIELFGESLPAVL